MTRTGVKAFLLAVACALLSFPPGWAQGSTADVTVLNGDTVWRCYTAFGTTAEEKSKRFSLSPGFTDPFIMWGYGIVTPPPPAEWVHPDFDDSGWVRRPGLTFGGYGEYQQDPALLCLRGRFGVADPATVKGMALELSYRGGIVVYLNGKEIARRSLPAGELEPFAEAEAYPREAFVLPNDEAILPNLGKSEPPAELQDRYALRFRKATVAIPAAQLRAGTNVLAIEIHEAQRPGDLPKVGGRLWSTAGLVSIALTAGAGSAVTPNTGAPAVVQVWNADPLQQVGRTIAYGDPCEPLAPVQLQAPVNGFSSGQVVVSAATALPRIAATATALKGEHGGTIPATAVRVRYADVSKSFIPLLDEPIAGAKLQPVWVTVKVPADARADVYTGVLQIDGLEKPVSVPIRLTVHGWRLADPQQWRTHVNLLQSPESVAGYYKVPLWSDAHFALLEKSLQLMGGCGNKVLGISAVGKSVFGDDPIIVFRKQGDSYVPEFAYLDRYLAVYNKYAGEPKFLSLHIWNYGMYEKGYGRDGGSQERAADTIPIVELRGDTLVPVEYPMYGKPGTEALWRQVADGLHARMQQLGWKNTRLLLGTSGDTWPSKETVSFFKQVAPDAQWRVITHGCGSPKWGETDAERTQPNGMVVGYLEMARRTGNLRKRYADHPVSSNARDHVGSNPYAYRELPMLHTGRANFDGFCWKGIDYWTYTTPEGQQRSALNTYVRFGNMVGGTPRSIAVPGPGGAVATVQYEMLREGCQDCEALLFLDGAVKDPALRAKIGDALIARWQAVRETMLDVIETGDRIDGAGDYRYQVAQLYAVAADVARAIGVE